MQTLGDIAFAIAGGVVASAVVERNPTESTPARMAETARRRGEKTGLFTDVVLQRASSELTRGFQGSAIERKPR